MQKNQSSKSHKKIAQNLVRSINRLALDKKISIGTAESCTGGALAAQIVEISGVSAWFFGSVVCYANSVKTKILGVKTESLQNFGAVSFETVSQMLTGACASLQVDLAVAISGIAGPDGGSEEKPVGTVFIGVGGLQTKEQQIQKYNFSGTRTEIQAQSKMQGLQNLENYLMNL